jgi:hypothetical protein
MVTGTKFAHVDSQVEAEAFAIRLCQDACGFEPLVLHKSKATLYTIERVGVVAGYFFLRQL